LLAPRDSLHPVAMAIAMNRDRKGADHPQIDATLG
jgi:hypothetical protein